MNMAVNNISYTRLRLSGLATGLDTDELIKNLMKVESAPLNKILQKKQLAEWKQEAYREITNLLRGMKDKYFDILKPSNYMLSQTNYKKFTATSTDSSVVTASGGVGAFAGTHKITVTNLAEAAKMTSSGNVTKAVGSTVSLTTGADSDVVNASLKRIKINLDGVEKEITLGNYTDVNTVSDVAADLQNKIGVAFGAGKVKVSATDGKLTFETMGGASKITLSDADTNNGLGFLHINSGTSNRISVSDTLDTLRTKLNSSFDFKTSEDGTQNVVITINSKTFQFSKDTTLSSMLNTINNDSTAKVNIAYDDVTDKFTITSDQTGAGNSLQISEDTSTFLAAINFKSFNGSQAAALSYTNEKFSVCIDGELKEFTINGNYASHSDLAQDIQNKLRDAFTGKNISVGVNADNSLSFSLDNTGSTLVISAANAATSALGLNNANYTQGEDAQFILNGQSVTRSSNTFTSNGVTFTLQKESPVEQTITLSSDVNGIYENIKSFIEKYNEVIETINCKLSEKYDRSYRPLTADEKEAMKEEEITLWEKKAKTGLLRNDSTLQSMVYRMRQALFERVEGVNISFADIGINTGSYTEKGKLTIDETKLKQAIQDDPDGVMNLFSKQSTSYSTINARNLTSDQRQIRYNEEGLAYRLFDIIEDNISTLRDSNGNKGALIQKAGITGDSSLYSNTIYDEIYKYDQKIKELTDKLADKEEMYYRKYASLESYISKMNSQSAWLSQQFGN
jgi:flagellar hook-associated protein 2